MHQFGKHKAAISKFHDITDHPENYLTIHYSCESFLSTHGGYHSPRITSIAIYDLNSKQTHAYSLHLAAEELNISLDDISNTEYNKLEANMLSRYMEFLSQNKNKTFIHWNMRDTTYGFLAIEHRYSVLCHLINQPNKLVEIPDTDKLNLSDLLSDAYGESYAKDPKMFNLVEQNAIKPKFFLTGKEEADAFEKHDFVLLHASTSSKVRIFAYIIDMAAEDTLKTKSTWKKKYGMSPQAIWEYAHSKWYTAILMGFFTLFIGGIIGCIIGKYI